jgi:hypothetical protein
MPLNQSQGQALTALLHTIRRDWGLAGITAALKKASPLGSAAEVAVAACRVAANEGIRSPSLIADPGPHWQGLAAGSRLAPVMCVTHPEQKAGSCAECFKAAVPRADLCPVPKRSKHLIPFVPEEES